ncbi:uncharacterized protein A4U43_C01F17130 [Asparagus officinalis]|uniref:Small ribosomal subunit protein mS29 n=1 Tax=Asparagus officinalis TaxID=4686 RepID=A0A5P1FTP9_ASPOF|nr:uncharacterized protein A4U43_C01F17130 [Asparagus officinalis]
MVAEGSHAKGPSVAHSNEMNLVKLKKMDASLRLALEECGIDYTSYHVNPITRKNMDTSIFRMNLSATLPDFLEFNKSRLQQLPCQISKPILLGEGVGVQMMKGVDSMVMPEGSILFDLVQSGITYSHASVGILVRSRKELSLVKDIL